VQRIVRAYEDYKGRNEQLSFDLKTSNGFTAPRVVSTIPGNSNSDSEAALASVPPADLASGSRISE